VGGGVFLGVCFFRRFLGVDLFVWCVGSGLGCGLGGGGVGWWFGFVWVVFAFLGGCWCSGGGWWVVSGWVGGV